MAGQGKEGLRSRLTVGFAGGGVAALAAFSLHSIGLDLAAAALMQLLAVIAVAWLGGLITAIVLSVLATLLLGIIFVEPHFSVEVASSHDLVTLGLFLLAAIAASVMVHRIAAQAERGRTEGNLRRSQEAFLEEAQRLSQTGSLAWNAVTGEVVWSEETYRICGVGRDTHLTLDFLLDRIQPEDREGFQRAVQAAVKGRARFDREIRFTRDDGEVRTLHMIGHFLVDKPGQFVGALNDITDRRRDELALRNSEFRYRNMFSAMAASFWELDFNGILPLIRNLKKAGVTDYPAYFADNPQFVRELMRATRIIDVNEQTVALFGRGDKAEVMDAGLDHFWPEPATDVYAGSVIASLQRKPGFSAETRLRRIDGTEFEALFTVSFPAEGIVSSQFLVGVIDISDRVSAQQALRRVEAEFAHAARLSTLGELAASIAHEVNQPLAAIATNASAGLRWLDRPEPNLEEVRTLATRISADARRAADIISRIRGMAMRRTTEKAPLLLGPVIEEAAAFLRHDLQAQKVTMQLALQPYLPPVLGDRTQLQQVIVNLAMNAAQAMGQQGEGPRRVLISASRTGDEISIDVDDNGPGIADGHLDQLFQSFFTTKEGGMGIGLPICRSIVEAHGGRISASNREGGGARFRFTLPVHAAD